MRALSLKILLGLCLFLGQNLSATELSDTDIALAVQRLDEINTQIATIKAQSADKNETAEQNSLFKGVTAKKSALLEKIPNFIMQTDVNSEQIAKFQDERAKLESSVKRLKNSSNKKAYIQNAIKLEKMKLDESFYNTLIGLEKLFNQGARTPNIKSTIEDGLLDIQTGSYLSIKELKDSLAAQNLDEYAAEFNSLEIYKKTFEEVLTYLRDNAELLSSNYFFTELNLKTAVNYINQNIGFSVPGVNIGKIVIVLGVFLFFISFTRILSKILSSGLLSLFSKDKYAEVIRDQVVNIIKAPIFLILMVYAVDICASVAYYPTPVPIKFANFISIALVVSFAWFVLRVLNGYGIIFINQNTKHSGRKEVINLILKIVYFIIVVIALLLILGRLGFNVSAIIASLGIGGLAIALATKDILANFFASVMLLFDNSFSQGDNIVCGGIEGVVVEIGLRKTTIRTADNALIFVPNLTLASDPIINWSRRRLGRLIKLTVGIEYKANAQQVSKCAKDIKDMLLAHPDIAKPEDLASNSIQSPFRLKHNIVSIDDLAGYKTNLFVAVDNLSESSIDILVYCFSKNILWGEYLEVKEDVILQIMRIIQENGLDFAFPSRSLYIENLKDINKI